MRNLLAGTLSVRAFCGKYEHTYNFEVDADDLLPHEEEQFARLFDVAVVYAEDEEGRRLWPGYTTEADVLLAAREVRTALGEGGDAG